MVWLQFFLKILRVHFSTSDLDNSNWDEISHSIIKKERKKERKKRHYLKHSATLFEIRKKNCKTNPLIQTLVYRSNMHDSKIDQMGK